jgi:hypothetical protein
LSHRATTLALLQESSEQPLSAWATRGHGCTLLIQAPCASLDAWLTGNAHAHFVSAIEELCGRVAQPTARSLCTRCRLPTTSRRQRAPLHERLPAARNHRERRPVAGVPAGKDRGLDRMAHPAGRGQALAQHEPCRVEVEGTLLRSTLCA